jgi:hypothetical protein
MIFKHSSVSPNDISSTLLEQPVVMMSTVVFCWPDRSRWFAPMTNLVQELLQLKISLRQMTLCHGGNFSFRASHAAFQPSERRSPFTLCSRHPRSQQRGCSSSRRGTGSIRPSSRFRRAFDGPDIHVTWLLIGSTGSSEPTILRIL